MLETSRKKTTKAAKRYLRSLSYVAMETDGSYQAWQFRREARRSACNPRRRTMPSKVLLRGFGPDIPENQIVTFCDDLPSKAACAQCDNVSAELHTDPRGHGYCPSCRKMCTNHDIFECPECEEDFHISQLTTDRSVRNRIKTMKVICPNATQGKPVQITFNALKAHLQGCSCGQINDAPDDSDQPSSISCSSMTMVRCPKCKEGCLKKEAFAHVKDCKGPRKPQPTQQQQVLSSEGSVSPWVDKQGPGTPLASDQSAKFCSVDPASVTGQPPELPAHPDTLTQQLRKARQEIRDLECKNAELEKELSEKNDILTMMKSDADRRLHMAQEAMAELKNIVASSLSAFKDECDRLRGDVDKLSSSINQVPQRFQEKLEEIAHIMFPHGQEGGPDLGQP